MTASVLLEKFQYIRTLPHPQYIVYGACSPFQSTSTEMMLVFFDQSYLLANLARTTSRACMLLRVCGHEHVALSVLFDSLL